MKKIIVFIICLISFSSTAKAFLGEDLGLNLYNDIDEGIEDLETKQYEYELSGQGKTITENVNNLLKSLGYGNYRFKEGLTVEKIEKIAKGNIQVLKENIEGGDNEDNNKITYINNIIKNYYINSKNKAEEKSKQIYYISNVGIYSDGNKKNSSFDLISDLQDIDQIIFNGSLVYPGENYEEADKLVNDLVDKTKESLDLIDEMPNIFDLTGNNENNTNNNNGINGNNNANNDINENICIEDINKSGLSSNSLNDILNNINNSSTSLTNNTNNNNNQEQQTQTQENNTENSLGDYSSVNDNSVWPCNQFFCINIDFIMYSQNLLGFGPNITIEYLIDRSNKHLGRFDGTSLAPKKMTTENFGLGLQNVNFVKMFNLNILIYSKPVPILNIENKEKEDSSEYSKNNLLEKYYNHYGLDYKRKNDINIFLNKEKKLKNILSSGNLTISDSINKTEQLNKFMSDNQKGEEITQKSIYNKVINSELEDFEKQFNELNIFTNNILEYVTNINNIINNMLKIPNI